MTGLFRKSFGANGLRASKIIFSSFLQRMSPVLSYGDFSNNNFDTFLSNGASTVVFNEAISLHTIGFIISFNLLLTTPSANFKNPDSDNLEITIFESHPTTRELKGGKYSNVSFPGFFVFAESDNVAAEAVEVAVMSPC